MTNIEPSKVMYHPITGAPLSPLGFRASGQPIWPVMGGSETPPEGGSGGDSGSGTSTGSTDSGGAGDGGNGSESSDSGGDKSDDTVSKADLQAALDRMKAADQRASKAEQELKALKDKDLGEKERAEQEATEAKAEVEKRDEVIQGLRLENAFLRDTTHTWHDPSDVLRFVRDDDRVTIDEDGTVKGLEAALKDLASKKPYLVKKAEEGEPPGPSGAPTGSNGRKGGDGSADRGKLLENYPQLRGRTRTQPR